MKRDKDLMVIMKLGTRNTRVLVARRAPDWQVDWTYTRPSCGLLRGAVANGRKTRDAIQDAMAAVAEHYGHRIDHVRLAVQGVRLLSGNASCQIEIDSRVSDLEIRQLEDAFLTMPPPDGRVLLHVLPQEYQLGSVISREVPCGRSGSPLSCNAHLVTLSQAALTDLQNCLRDARMTADRLVLQSLAAGEAVLNADEKDFGTLVIQMGAGVTEFILYTDSGPSLSGSLMLGGNDLVHAVARHFLLEHDVAERLVLAHGCARHLTYEPDYRLRLLPMHRTVPLRVQRRNLNMVVECFLATMLGTICRRLERDGWMTRIGAGVVLTGGLAHLPGIAELAARLYGLPARVGYTADPLDPSGLATDPAFAALLGVLRLSVAVPQPIQPPDILHC